MTVLHAPAKLTLSLRITGRRADGYHLIDAEMVSLDFGDRIDIEPATETTISVTGPYADGVPTDERNLVWQALARHGRSARVEINKQIPHGGGLGGGSTDAAAVLRWIGAHGTKDAVRDAASIGADVAYCLVGGRARVRGIGEDVISLPHQQRTVTLVIPPLTVSTPAAYQAWDDMSAPTAAGPNDLEPAAVTVEPRLMWWRDEITRRCGREAVLAGSGATWFVHGTHDNALAALGNEGAQIIVATTMPASPTSGEATSPTTTRFS